MAQQREKEDSETLSTCTQPLQLSSPPLPSTTGRLLQFTSPSPGSDPLPLPDKLTKRKREENQGNRCSCFGCRKKLGLMGFRCRCGEIFCPQHRYSDRHDCGFDYKAAGREAIARENPVVRAAKLLKV